MAIRAELRAEILRLGDRQIRGSGKILDLGCGTGWFLRVLLDEGVEPGRLHGIDALSTRVEAARERAPGVQVELGDTRDLAFDDESFSLVLLLTVLSSLGSAEEVRGALTEARRVLAPGGLLLTYEPRIPNPMSRHTRLIRDRDLDAAGLRDREEVRLTLLPALARRLGEHTASRYERLVRVPGLSTHRLIAFTAPPSGGGA